MAGDDGLWLGLGGGCGYGSGACAAGGRGWTWVDVTYWAVSGNASALVPNTTTGVAEKAVTVNLASTSLSGHLDPSVHPWCTYTYDIVVRELDGETQLDRYGLKEPYCMWIPAHPPGQTTGEGHSVWVHVPEEENAPAELRVSYAINDQCLTPNAQDFNLIVVDPLLQEHAAIGKPWPDTTGVMHGVEDLDEDGKPDGIKVYEFTDDDPGGTWRVLWTAEAPCGTKTRYRRTHDAQRMLVANADGVPAVTCAGRGSNGPYRYQALRSTLYWQTHMMCHPGYQAQRCSAKEEQITSALKKTAVFSYYGHGTKTFLDIGDAYNLSNLDQIDMERCRFVLWMHCESADKNNGYNFVDRSIARGADCAVGWLTEVKTSAFPNFASAFWCATCSLGQEVGWAADHAAWTAWAELPGFMSAGILNCWTAGDARITLTPPRYGDIIRK